MTLADALAWIEGTAFAVTLRESASIWAYPTVLTLHTIGLAVLVGASTALDLRLLGCARAIPVAAFAPSFRVMWIGFWINAVSGVVLFTAEATTKGSSATFVWKLGIIALCVVNMWVIRRVVFERPAAPLDAGALPKLLAASSLALWVIAIALGRWMAYA
ncbi:MAG: hypothetical protein FJW14_17985 [Acidimicrobiia bacterium]|nr:hypothetical protein [Acidimicrobiia bacterium]